VVWARQPNLISRSNDEIFSLNLYKFGIIDFYTITLKPSGKTLKPGIFSIHAMRPEYVEILAETGN